MPLLDFYEVADKLHLVMPRYAGSVADVLRKTGKPLDEPTALRVAADMFTALKGLHEYRIVHRVWSSFVVFHCIYFIFLFLF